MKNITSATLHLLTEVILKGQVCWEIILRRGVHSSHRSGGLQGQPSTHLGDIDHEAKGTTILRTSAKSSNDTTYNYSRRVPSVCLHNVLQISTVTIPLTLRLLMSYIQVSQEERAKLREGVPYVKLYRYNPKHLYPKLNGYGDNGQRSLEL